MHERLTDAEVAAVRERWEARAPHTAEYWDGQPCGACGAVVGAYHEEGCDHERCPHCGDQTISCGNCQGETAREVFPRLLATLEAERARVRALVAAIEACDQAMSSLGDGTEWDWVVLYQVKAGHWHKVLGIARGAMPIDGALTRGEAGTDGE